MHQQQEEDNAQQNQEQPGPMATILIPAQIQQYQQPTATVQPHDSSIYDFDHAEGHIDDDDAEDEEDEDEDEEDLNEEVDDMDTAGDTINNSTASKKRKIKRGSSDRHVCNYCNYTTHKRYLLSRHMKSHSEDRPHRCGICERGFKTAASLQNHVNTHSGVRPHNCKDCDAQFTTSGELVRHVRYKHTHEKPHACSECDYASVELSKLKRHMRCHTGERPYQCQHCTYASPDTYKLKRHLRIHTGEKPYECDVCHARFTQSNSLKAHRLIHSGNKPVYRCDKCPATCGRKTDLRIHVQKLHTAEKPLTCKRCDKAYPDRYQYKLHLKTHEGEKCFKCELCSYSSVSSRHLDSHMLIHTDQKPFSCDDCDQSFRQKQLLKRHRNLYHNPSYVPPTPREKTHECGVCNKAFRHKGNLMRHMVTHDPDASKNLTDMDDSQMIGSDEEDEDSSAAIIGDASGYEGDETGQQTISFSYDPQNNQLLQVNGEGQVVVYEVVPLPAENQPEGDQQADPNRVDLVENQNAPTNKPESTEHPSTPLRRSTRSAARGASSATPTNQQSSSQATATTNSTITVQASNGSRGSALGATVSATTPAGNKQTVMIVHDTSMSEVEKQMREHLEKQKDVSECFGFKDDDEEDEAILSIPATHVN